MHKNNLSLLMLLLLALALVFAPILPARVKAEGNPAPHSQVGAYDLIAAMNILRMSYGYAPLIEDPIINAVAQSTAQVMADGLLSWHIGNVGGRLAGAGYGGGKTVFATENFAIAGDGATIDQIMLMWADFEHMRPAASPNYCHVGAGTAKASNGMTYFILQAAYISGEACQSNPVGTPLPGQTPGNYGLITPVELVEPDADGNYLHTVKPGQSFWSIAVAYGVTIKDILLWNNLSESYVLQSGDKLMIAGPGSQNMVTPTPLGNVIKATPDAEGKIVHEVQAYQNLSKIGEAYNVSVAELLRLNALAVDTPLQIGQKLLIKGPNQTPTFTPLPLTPLQRLTPAADGKYYHVVADGQNLVWIASLYGIQLSDLLAWNYLNASSVIYPGNRLLLQVTPPATNTPISEPATATPPPTPTFTPGSSPTATRLPLSTPTPTETPNAFSLTDDPANWLWLLAFAAIGVAVYFITDQIKKDQSTRPKDN
jgi:LysM repeat protein